MIVSPTEPAALRSLGLVSQTPERYGVDVLWASTVSGLVGVQRKAFPDDFIASVTDGRLAREIGQMQRLHLRALAVEGRPTWTTEGALVADHGQPWTKAQHRRYLASVQARGVWVFDTANLDDTISLVRDLEAWAAKPSHHATQRREKAKRDRWGRADSRAWQVHLVQGVADGIGPELAGRILDTVGMPFGLRVTEDELIGVPGVGKKKARQIVAAFEGPT